MARSWIYGRARSIFVTVALLAIVGGVASRGMPVALFPAADFPRVVVDVDAGDRPAEQMTVQVTRLLEETVRLVPGVRHVRSETGRGTASVTVEFAWGEDMVRAVMQVQAALARVSGQFPAATTFEVRHLAPELTPVYSYSLTSEHRSPAQLQDLARFQLAPRLIPVPGVLRVEVLGGDTEEFAVDVDPVRLDALSVTLGDVAAAVAANNVQVATGRLEDHYKLYLVMAEARIKGVQDLGEIVVKSVGGRLVRVGDVAAIRRGPAPSWTRVTADGRPAVLVNVYQRPGGNTSQIAEDVKAAVADAAPTMPKDVTVANWYDQSGLILDAVASVRDAILLGVFLAAVVLLAFLRDVRLTTIAIVVVPTVLAIATLVMSLLGMSFNIMTLGGMAAAVGLIIDDAIVLLEHLVRRLHEAPSGGDAATVAKAAREFTAPLVGSSLATLVIHIPPAFLSGAAGAFFKALSMTMAICLVVSLAVTWLVVPLLASQLWRTLRDHKPKDAGTRGGISRLYSRLLGVLLARPLAALAAVVALAVAGGLAFSRLGTGFMPEMDEGGFVLDYVAPPGTSLTETDRLVRQVEGILRAVPDVATYSRRTGLGMGGGFHPPNEGDFFVRLKPRPRRDIAEVMADVRHKITAELPGLDVEILQLMEDLIGDLTAVPQPIEVKLFGDDGELLAQVAGQVAKVLARVPGLVDLKAGSAPAGAAVVYTVDRRKAALEGLDAEVVSKSVSDAYAGVVATSVVEGPKTLGIRVGLAARLRRSENSLANLKLKAADGHILPLRRIATVATVAAQPVVVREDLKRMVPVTARLSGRGLGGAAAAVRQALAAPGLLPKGIYYRLGGLYEEQQRSFREIGLVMAAAAALVFLTLLVLYESFTAALSVIAMPILAMPAVFLGLWVTGTPLNISTMMGLTMIIGIVTEVGIFYMSELRTVPGQAMTSATLVAAGVNRLRPITMTSLAAILTLLPLALGLGEGAAMQRPLAVATIAGLTAQLPLVLLVLPVLYQAISRLKYRRESGGLMGQRTGNL